MTAEGPQAGLTHSRSLIVDPSVIVPALPPLLGPLADMPPVLLSDGSVVETGGLGWIFAIVTWW